MELPNLSGTKMLVYDAETSGFSWHNDFVCGHVVTWGPRPDETIYLPVRHPTGNVEVDVEGWLSELADDPNRLWVGHNMKFDMHMAASHGVNFAGKVDCTRNRAALLNENQRGYDLENCAKEHGVQAKKSQLMYDHLAEMFDIAADKKSMGMFHQLDGQDPIAHEYANGDGTTTWQLWHAQELDIREEELERCSDVETRVLKALFQMERRGVKVDEEELQRFINLLDEEEKKCRKVLGEDFNPRSPTQLREMFSKYEDKWIYTAKGAPSFTEKWLKTIPEGEVLIRLRQVTNMRSSFALPLRDTHMVDGRVHTTYNQMKMDDYGTVTGRLSSSEPNMQQVPKRNKEWAIPFRRIFIPDRGYVWSANDYSQQEYRVFADYVDSETLINGYKSNPPIDIHTMVAQMLDVERDPTAKRTNLGKLYGMGVKRMAEELGITVRESKQIDSEYHNQFPEVRPFLRGCESVAKQRGYVKTKLGRRRRFVDRKFAHKAGNSVIQMCSADITKSKMAEICEFFESEGQGAAHMLLQVHDELDWQIQDDGGGQLINEEAKRIMQSFGSNDVIEMKVPMSIDCNLAKNWSEATFGEQG